MTIGEVKLAEAKMVTHHATRGDESYLVRR